MVIEDYEFSVNSQQLAPVIGNRAAEGQHDSMVSTRNRWNNWKRYKVLMIVEVCSRLQADKSNCSICKQQGINSLSSHQLKHQLESFM